MKKARSILLFALTITIILVLFLAYQFVRSTSDRDSIDPEKRAEMLSIVLERCKLEQIPESVESWDVKKSGSVSASEITLVVNGEEGVLQKWMNASELVKSVEGVLIDGVFVYELGWEGKSEYPIARISYEVSRGNGIVTVYVAHD